MKIEVISKQNFPRFWRKTDYNQREKKKKNIII